MRGGMRNPMPEQPADQPLVLTEVEPDCACSVAQWTKTPIAPGAKGTVNAVSYTHLDVYKRQVQATYVRDCLHSGFGSLSAG